MPPVCQLLLTRGGKNFLFFDASRFTLVRLCLNADKLIIGILKLKSVHPLQHSVCPLHRLLWKLLYGSILSSMKSAGGLTRPTQFVRCVEQNLNTSATQQIWETTLRDTTQRWERSSDLLHMPARERSSRRWHSFNQIQCKFYFIGFKTIFRCEERGFTLEPRYKIPSLHYFTDADIPTFYSETKTGVLDTLLTAGR